MNTSKINDTTFNKDHVYFIKTIKRCKAACIMNILRLFRSCATGTVVGISFYSTIFETILSPLIITSSVSTTLILTL